MSKRILLRRVEMIGLTGSLLAGLVSCQGTQGGAGVMATVDGRKITSDEVEKYYGNQTAGSDQKPTGEQAVSLRLGILKELIETEMLMRRAEKLGLLATDEDVDKKLNEIKSPFSPEQFNQKLAEKKITLEDFKRDLRRSLTLDKVLNKEVSSRINVSDQEITDYYNANKSEFNLIEPQYHLAQILVTTQPNKQVRNLQNNKAQNEAEARKKIQMLENRLDSGDDFATLAMNYSEDPDVSNNGGDLGFSPESAFRNTDSATRDAVLKLKPGQYSAAIPIVNPANHQVAAFRIVKLVAREQSGQRAGDDPRTREAIRQQLHDRREQLLKAAYYEVLRDQAKVENQYAEQVLKNAGAAK